MKKLFYIYDSVEEVNVGYFECQSLDVLLRNNGKIFAQMSPHYVSDWKFYCLGNALTPINDGHKLDISQLLDIGVLKPINITSLAEVEQHSAPMTVEEVEKLKSENNRG